MNAIYNYFYPSGAINVRRQVRKNHDKTDWCALMDEILATDKKTNIRRKISSFNKQTIPREENFDTVSTRTCPTSPEMNSINVFLESLEQYDDFMSNRMKLDIDYLTSNGKRKVSIKDQEQAWRILIKTNDLEGAKRFIELGGEVNIGNSEYNILFIAIAESRDDFLQLLIDAGADINWRGMLNLNSLDFSMEVGTYESTEILVKAGVNISMIYFIHDFGNYYGMDLDYSPLDYLPKNNTRLPKILRGKNDKTLTSPYKDYIDWDIAYYIDVEPDTIGSRVESFMDKELVEEYSELPIINYEDWYLYSKIGKVSSESSEQRVIIYHWKTKKYSTDNAMLIYYSAYDSTRFIIQSGDDYICGTCESAHMRISTKYMYWGSSHGESSFGNDIYALGEASIENAMKVMQRYLHSYSIDN